MDNQYAVEGHKLRKGLVPVILQLLNGFIFPPKEVLSSETHIIIYYSVLFLLLMASTNLLVLSMNLHMVPWLLPMVRRLNRFIPFKAMVAFAIAHALFLGTIDR
ncbi:hypothetical protein QJS10_CPB21g01013 [Acorus calamus]|uniref:Uncharacterized protein n=1 Tax=Acorus calamus TaxID=4465 RepID=A0AAV9C4M3_ACOCL|nr:hypothetical protein QJS10_CPB21g01013 [Acorus calamus]